MMDKRLPAKTDYSSDCVSVLRRLTAASYREGEEYVEERIILGF